MAPIWSCMRTPLIGAWTLPSNFVLAVWALVNLASWATHIPTIPGSKTVPQIWSAICPAQPLAPCKLYDLELTNFIKIKIKPWLIYKLLQQTFLWFDISATIDWFLFSYLMMIQQKLSNKILPEIFVFQTEMSILDFSVATQKQWHLIQG